MLGPRRNYGVPSPNLVAVFLIPHSSFCSGIYYGWNNFSKIGRRVLKCVLRVVARSKHRRWLQRPDCSAWNDHLTFARTCYFPILERTWWGGATSHAISLLIKIELWDKD